MAISCGTDLMVVVLGILLVKSWFEPMTAFDVLRLVLYGSGGGTDSASVLVIWPNWLSVVNWKMGTGVSLSGVTAAGGTACPVPCTGLHSPSMRFRLFINWCAGLRLRPTASSCCLLLV